MSEAKKCDRCGNFYDIYETDNHAAGFRFIDKRYNLSSQTIYDLCPYCMGELINWLANPAVKILYSYDHIAYSNSSNDTLDFSTTDMNGEYSDE